MLLRLLLRAIVQTLQALSPGVTNADQTVLHMGAVAFIHRFGSRQGG